MRQLIKDGRPVDDHWTLLRNAAAFADVAANAPAIVPLALWLVHRDDLLARRDIGVWLAPDDDPEAIAADIGRLPLIAVEFPQFTDGRGYSIGRLLRDRHGFGGELRAVGDVLRDQLFALAECGFDAFAIRGDRDAVGAISGLRDFSGVYAPTARTPQPWFRRRRDSSAVGTMQVDMSAVTAVPSFSN